MVPYCAIDWFNRIRFQVRMSKDYYKIVTTLNIGVVKCTSFNMFINKNIMCKYINYIKKPVDIYSYFKILNIYFRCFTRIVECLLWL